MQTKIRQRMDRKRSETRLRGGKVLEAQPTRDKARARLASQKRPQPERAKERTERDDMRATGVPLLQERSKSTNNLEIDNAGVSAEETEKEGQDDASE